MRGLPQEKWAKIHHQRMQKESFSTFIVWLRDQYLIKREFWDEIERGKERENELRAFAPRTLSETFLDRARARVCVRVRVFTSSTRA